VSSLKRRAFKLLDTSRTERLYRKIVLPNEMMAIRFLSSVRFRPQHHDFAKGAVESICIKGDARLSTAAEILSLCRGGTMGCTIRLGLSWRTKPSITTPRGPPTAVTVAQHIIGFLSLFIPLSVRTQGLRHTHTSRNSQWLGVVGFYSWLRMSPRVDPPVSARSHTEN
jgi:hypothetical protein